MASPKFSQPSASAADTPIGRQPTNCESAMHTLFETLGQQACASGQGTVFHDCQPALPQMSDSSACAARSANFQGLVSQSCQHMVTSASGGHMDRSRTGTTWLRSATKTILPARHARGTSLARRRIRPCCIVCTPLRDTWWVASVADLFREASPPSLRVL